MEKLTVGYVAQLTPQGPLALPMGGQAALDAARAPFIELAKLREDVKALRKDAERYRWLRARLLAVDWDYMGTGDTVLVFTVPSEISVSADCDATIDSAMLAEPGIGAA